MNMKAHSERATFFRMGMRWPKGQRISVPRHCEERHYLEIVNNKVHSELTGNKRRSNLLWLTKTREPFSTFFKNSSLQTQCKEIAEEPLAGRIMPLCLAKCDDNEILPPAKGSSSGMQQYFAKFISTAYSTMPRNDECIGEGRWIRELSLQQRIEIIL
jgi:hypothetical protein